MLPNVQSTFVIYRCSCATYRCGKLTMVGEFIGVICRMQVVQASANVSAWLAQALGISVSRFSRQRLMTMAIIACCFAPPFKTETVATCAEWCGKHTRWRLFVSNFWENNVGNTGFYVTQDARSTCRMNSGVQCVFGVLLVSCVCIFFAGFRLSWSCTNFPRI